MMKKVYRIPVSRDIEVEASQMMAISNEFRGRTTLTLSRPENISEEAWAEDTNAGSSLANEDHGWDW